jgi:CRP-like cAMP-binding protein
MHDSANALIQFREHISGTNAISQESWEILQTALKVVALKPRSLLLREGAQCNAIFFIVRGYCRSYYRTDEVDVNTGFFFENDFATNVKALVTGSASEYFIITCESAVIVELDKRKLLAAYEGAAEIERFGRRTLESLLAKQEEWSDLFRLFTAQQRYEYLQEHRPEMLQRVSLTQLSSYLGISRETLSRIRARRSRP